MSRFSGRMANNKHPYGIPKATTCSRKPFGVVERNINITLQPSIIELFSLNLRGEGRSCTPPQTVHFLGNFPLLPIAQRQPPNSQGCITTRVPNNIIPSCPYLLV